MARHAGTGFLAIGNQGESESSAPLLRFVNEEVTAITRLVEDATVLLDEEATETNVRNQLGDKSIIHFACHAEMNPAYPMYSGLILRKDEENDGRLQVHELFTLHLDADLVVLSLSLIHI